MIGIVDDLGLGSPALHLRNVILYIGFTSVMWCESFSLPLWVKNFWVGFVFSSTCMIFFSWGGLCHPREFIVIFSS